jgi:APA family basic amino acid/polyamine antiporter
LLQAIAVGIGGTIGGGVFTLIGVAAGRAGPAALLSFTLAFGLATLLALCYAELASRLPRAGGGYAFVKEAFGPEAGFLAGWAYWSGYLVVSGYVILGFGGYFEALTGLPRIPAGIGLVCVLTSVNLLGVRISARIQMVVVATEVLILLLVAVIGAIRADPARLVPFAPNGPRGVLGASLAAFLAFGGFDQVAALGEEVRDPRRNLPLAIAASLTSVLVLYAGLLYAALGSAGYQELGDSAAPLLLAASRFLGPRAAVVVPLAAVLTTSATTNAVLLVMSRVLYAMGRDRLVPEWMGRLQARRSVPASAIIVSGLGMACVAFQGNVHRVVGAAGFLYTVCCAFTLAAYFRLRHAGGPPPVFAAPWYPGTPTAALILVIIMMVQAGTPAAVAGSALLAAGVVARLTWRRLERGRAVQSKSTPAPRGGPPETRF